MRILHISGDYPDPLAPAKTRAVSNLLAMADGHEHRVVSINRVDWRAGIRALTFSDAAGEAHRAVAYGAPPKGLFMARFLSRLAEWIEADMLEADFTPDLVHAHKLTIEGLAADRVAELCGAPLTISVQGNTDLKIAQARRDLRPRYTTLWRERADLAFPFAPWARQQLDALLGARTKPIVDLPVPGPADAILTPRQVEPVIRTAFNFKDAANKNAARLIRAVARAADTVPEIRLELVGGGDPASFARLAALADQAAPGRVRFLGAVPHSEIQALFNASCAFALVSHRESFGMVFSEALLAGAPCLIPRGRAIDGFLEDGGVVIAADPESEEEIAAGLVRLVREQAAFKDRLGALAASGGLDFLRRDAIRATYLDAIAPFARVEPQAGAA